MRDFRPPVPADGLGLPPSGLRPPPRLLLGEGVGAARGAHTAFLQSDSARPRHARDLVQSPARRADMQSAYLHLWPPRPPPALLFCVWFFFLPAAPGVRWLESLGE